MSWTTVSLALRKTGPRCQDTDFSEKYELGLEEKLLRMFPRISLSNSEHESEELRKPIDRKSVV